MQVHIGTCRSKSRGYVKATSKDTKDAPRIKFNYMSHKEDWEDMRSAIEVARQIMRQPSLKNIVGNEILPGKHADVDGKRVVSNHAKLKRVDALSFLAHNIFSFLLKEYIRNHVESAYHPCGTARMGNSPRDGAVVDNQGRVFGVNGLRIADASIFPQITNGNLNAPVIMVAERISDMILEKTLPQAVFKEDNRPWQPPFWGTDREKDPIHP